MRLCVESVTETANFCRISETARLWHHRLGHLSKSGLKKLVNMADGIDVKKLETVSELCETYIEGKQTRYEYLIKLSASEQNVLLSWSIVIYVIQ